MKNKKWHKIFDWIVIILGMSYGLSILSELFFIKGLGLVIPYTFFLFLAHIVRFGLKFTVLRNLKNSPLILIYLIILVFDFIQTAFFSNSTEGLANSLARIVYIFFYVSYLSNLYYETSLDYLLKPYFTYILYNVCIIGFMAILIIGGVSWQQNEVAYQLLLHNIQDGNSGATYYFPYYISIVANFHEYSVIPLFPGITGLSHEPHVIMWIISPAMIMMLAYKTKKCWLFLFIFLFIFVLLETFSTMALLAFAVVAVLQFIWMSQKKRMVLYIIPLIIVAFIISAYFGETLSLIFEVIGAKTSSTGGSSDYSMDMLRYIVSFKGLLGYGNIPPDTGNMGESVDPNISAGFITGLLDVIIYFILVVNSIRLSMSKKKPNHYFGLGFLYMLIHGLKVNYLVFGYPLFALLVFVMQTIHSSKGRNLQELSVKSIY